jgi:hypothetical protein
MGTSRPLVLVLVDSTLIEIVNQTLAQLSATQQDSFTWILFLDLIRGTQQDSSIFFYPFYQKIEFLWKFFCYVYLLNVAQSVVHIAIISVY